MKKETEILIIGAGIAGLALARSLLKAGFAVITIDQGPKPQLPSQIANGRTTALMNDTLSGLCRLGVQGLDQCTPLQNLRLIDPNATPELDITFNAKEIGLEHYGRNVPVDWLRYQLLNSVKKNCFFEQVITKIDAKKPSALHVTLSNGQDIKTQILIGADGRLSSVRSLAAIDLWQHDYKQTALTCVLSHSLPHHNTSVEYHYSGGPFTLVPLQGQQSSLVWLEKTSHAQQILSLNKKDVVQRIQRLTKGVLGEIKLETAIHSWPIYAAKALKIISHRIALIGESAHVMPPTGAQGLNLSLRDVFDLTDILVDALKRGEDIGSTSVLSRYEKLRESDINTRLKASDILNRSIISDSVFSHSLRRLGMRFLSAPHPLRRLIMQKGLAPERSVWGHEQNIEHKRLKHPHS